MSNCYRTSDNKYTDAPPRMADGRHFTDYRPSCELNNDVNRDNNLSNSFEARLFLQRNADQLMEVNRNMACQKNCNGVCGDEAENDLVNEGFTSTMLPELTTQLCNDNGCDYILNNPNGLGLGRQYYTVEQENEDQKVQNNLPENNCAPNNNFLVTGYENNSDPAPFN